MATGKEKGRELYREESTDAKNENTGNGKEGGVRQERDLEGLPDVKSDRKEDLSAKITQI